MFKNLVLHRVYIAIAVILGTAIVVYQKSGSLALGGVAPFVLIVIWMSIEFVYARLSSSAFLEYIAKYGRSVENRDLDCVQDYMFFNDEANPISVSVVSDGVYICRALICMAIIPWSSIQTLCFFNHKGIFLVRLIVEKEGESNRSLCLPWRREFNEKIPSHISLVNN